jgi:hypothetical protein
MRMAREKDREKKCISIKFTSDESAPLTGLITGWGEKPSGKIVR